MIGCIRASPKLALGIGLLVNMVMYVVMLYYNNKNATIFVPINIGIKAIPLYIVWNEKIQWMEDAKHIGILVGIFLLWNWAVGENVIQNLSMFVSSWKTGETSPKYYPGTAFLRDLHQKLST
jgi:hypothetical protein